MKLKHAIICLLIVVPFGMNGCGAAAVETPLIIHEDQSGFEINVESNVASKDCFVCGDSKESLMGYYSKIDSIGIIYWNNRSIINSDVRRYNDDGKELFEEPNFKISMSSFGKGFGNISVKGTPSRGYTDVSISVKEKDKVNIDQIKNILCQDCLDSVIQFYEDQKNARDSGHDGTTGYCLVDFTTRKLYTLSDPYCGYSIRDYYVRYDLKEGPDGCENLELFIFYAPIRSEEKTGE